ncbi:pyridoxamine 5'-phosphate oxidase family protein [Pseudolysinimonas sp.]|uniref:pyridoxamine 5'-phosphate oxidase family protein n=1 Tax=Pseudolysinimonas sp. TaxID=2680009 RepID=UPI0037840189
MTDLASRLWTNAAPTDDPVAVLAESACWRALEATPVGRIAIAIGEDVEVFPVNYTTDGGRILFRTAPGSKLLALTAHPTVTFEIDGFDDAAAFSIVVKGRAERIESQQEMDAADLLPLAPWIPTLKYRWVRIIPTEITGRVFRRDREPDRYV